MKSEIIIMTQGDIDSILADSKRWENRYMEKLKETIALSKKLVERDEWEDKAIDLINKLIKENNELRDRLDEANTWVQIYEEHEAKSMEEFQ